MALIIVPVMHFNFSKNVNSEIDNRKLQELTDFQSKTLEKYVNDRIGYREQMVNVFNRFNSDVFGIMAHPSTSWGKSLIFFQQLK